MNLYLITKLHFTVQVNVAMVLQTGIRAKNYTETKNYLYIYINHPRIKICIIYH